ncbi:SDR family NAD(P)-dependent oxidoreductase [Archangium minus]
MNTLVNRTAVVTGAASGIGKALAHRLAREGCHLALVDIDGEALERARGEFASTGRTVSLHVANVADRARMLALPEEVLAAHGHVHLLVNNAGVSVAGRFEEVGLEDLDWIFGVNFWGMVHGCKAFLPHLRREPEAHIVNLCSSFGLLGFAGKTGYSARPRRASSPAEPFPPTGSRAASSKASGATPPGSSSDSIIISSIGWHGCHLTCPRR